MSLTLLFILLGVTAVLLIIEHASGHPPLSLDLKLKGDIKRESWWLQQYGQAVCTAVAAPKRLTTRSISTSGVFCMRGPHLSGTAAAAGSAVRRINRS